jgi:hypothetical protein
MRVDKDTILLYMPQGGEQGMIQAWYAGQRSWVEFRGPRFSEWEPTLEPSAFEIAHDCLLGMHCTVLHQDSVLALVRGRHSDFDAIERAMAAETARYEPPDDAVIQTRV